MFGPTGGNRGRSYGGGYGNSYPRRWRTHPQGMRRTRTNHLRNIDALGNPKKPYRPSAGPGCGLALGFSLGAFLALALGAGRFTTNARGG